MYAVCVCGCVCVGVSVSVGVCVYRHTESHIFNILTVLLTVAWFNLHARFFNKASVYTPR